MHESAKSTQPNPSPRSSTQQSVKMHREPEVQGTCTTPLCEKWHAPECLFDKSENGCRFGEKCPCAHRQVNKQPSKRSKKNGDKSAVAMLKITRQLGCVFQDMEPPKSTTILRKSSNILNQSDVFDSLKPCYVMLTFETRIHRLE